MVTQVTEAPQQCILPRNHDKATDEQERIGYEKRMLVMKYMRDREDCDYMWSV